MKALIRIVLKGLLLFLLIDLAFGLGSALKMGNLSLYNRVFPGRQRFPFGESPQQAYNFSLSDLDAMFNSHVVSQPKPADEFRVLVIGDSSVWGTLLTPEETLTGRLNGKGLAAPDGRKLHFYNLGYPTISLTKDLLVLDRAASKYQPDAVIWLVTLEAAAKDSQLSVPLVEENPRETAQLIERYSLELDRSQLAQPTFWQSTLIGRRKELADVARLQLYGVMWAATGIDQVYPADYPRAQIDLEAKTDFHGATTWGSRPQDYLAFAPLAAGKTMLGDIPLLVVNEPILISRGKNSDLRYNFYYPCWAYDQYQEEIEAYTRGQAIETLNAWDLVPSERFTNSAIHIDKAGEETLAAAVAPRLQTLLAGGAGQ